MTVRLPDERRRTVWARWFTDAFPAAHRFSVLDADSNDAVDEIPELASTRMAGA